MREIKFRAWDKVTGTMYTDLNFPDNYLIDLNMDVWDTKKKGPFGLGEVVYNRFELIQFTGLKDKNGVEIYEKDVLECDGYRVEVIFKDGQFLGYNEGLPIKETTNRSWIHWTKIGNTLENPELLKD